MKHEKIIKELMKKCLIYDIETSSFDKQGKPINIRKDFDEYVKNAVVKWFGAYSYKDNRYYEYNCITQREEVKRLIDRHEVLIGFNNIEFDGPVIKNNELLTNKYTKELDMKLILGNDTYRPGFKQRANYMKIKLKPIIINEKRYGANTLQAMAHAFKLDTIKGDINYEIFYKNSWTPDEEKEIIKYLRADVEVTKQLFDRTVQFWSLFTDWLHADDVKKWSWINSTIAVLAYIIFCRKKGVEPTFSNAQKEEDKMGGRAVEPSDEEVFGAHYMDEVSKYPHTYAEFNLLSEINTNGQPQWKIDKLVKEGKLFHGNEKFKVKGYYDLRKQGVLEQYIVELLRTRIAIKKVLKQYYKDNITKIETPELLKDQIPNGELTPNVIQVLEGLEYAIKILLNSLYGINRNPVFEQLYTENAGHDCCWIGQQIHEYIHKFFEDRGFKVIGGFTDSWFIEDQDVSEDEIMRLARECMDELKKHIPFPEETHQIGYECYMDTIIYSYDDKRKEYKKNNYAFISNGKVKIVGFPIKKSNASKLAIHIFKKYLEPEAINKKRLKFEKSYVEQLIKEELEKDLSLTAITVKCNNADSYKVEGQIQAQISREYLNGLDGEIDVIKNKKIGKVGKGDKYCTVEEAKEYGLRFEDLILDKVWNELEPFLIKTKTVTLFDFEDVGVEV